MLMGVLMHLVLKMAVSMLIGRVPMILMMMVAMCMIVRRLAASAINVRLNRHSRDVDGLMRHSNHCARA